MSQPWSGPWQCDRQMPILWDSHSRGIVYEGTPGYCHLVNGDQEPIIYPKPNYPDDYEEFTNPPNQEQNDEEELARRVSKKMAQYQSRQLLRLQSAPNSPSMESVGDLHSSSPLQLDQAVFLLLAAAAGPAGLASKNQLKLN